ncbi:hypothetical protein ACTFIW_000863 [Dictyostelium discoideum]
MFPNTYKVLLLIYLIRVLEFKGVKVKWDGALIFICQAQQGTGIIAGSKVRVVLEFAVIKDVMAKSLGASNPINQNLIIFTTSHVNLKEESVLVVECDQDSERQLVVVIKVWDLVLDTQERSRYEGGQLPLYRKLPQRGFSTVGFRKKLDSINLDQIEAIFEESEVVNMLTLREKGFLKGASCGFKVLGNGDLAKKVTFEATAFSKSALEKLQMNGISFSTKSLEHLLADNSGLAVFPSIFGSLMYIASSISYFFGGTALLILVGVVIDTMKQIESHLIMKKYDGFLRKWRSYKQKSRNNALF